MLNIIDDYVYLTTVKDYYRGRIIESPIGWFISFFAYSNGAPFKDLHLNKQDLYQQLLGYTSTGDWPYCNTKEDLLKILNFLSKYKRNNSIFIDLENCL